MALRRTHRTRGRTDRQTGKQTETLKESISGSRHNNGRAGVRRCVILLIENLDVITVTEIRSSLTK